MTTSVKPVAGDDHYTFTDAQLISGNMLSNDIAGANGKLYLRDFDGDDVLAKIAGQVTSISGQYGTFHLQADGTWSYTLNDAAKVNFYSGQTLTETMQYKISDGAGHTDVGIFTLNVQGTTPAPSPHTTAVTLNFEDRASNDYIQDDHGFNFSTPGPYGDQIGITTPSETEGVGFAAVSQEAGGNVGYSYSGAPLTIEKADHATFDFEGGFFAGVFGGGPMTITGWHNGVQVYSDTETLTTNAATHVTLDWHNIDHLQITLANGENLTFDDLQFHV